MKKQNIYILLILLFINVVYAEQFNTTNYNVVKTSIGTHANETETANYIISSELNKEIVFQNRSTTYLVCNGYYCLIKGLIIGNVTVPVIVQQGASGGRLCPGTNQILLTDINQIVCIDDAGLRSIGLPLNDYQMTLSTLGRLVFMSKLPYIIIGLLIIVFLFYWFFFRKRDEEKEEKEKKQEEDPEQESSVDKDET